MAGSLARNVYRCILLAYAKLMFQTFWLFVFWVKLVLKASFLEFKVFNAKYHLRIHLYFYLQIDRSRFFTQVQTLTPIIACRVVWQPTIATLRTTKKRNLITSEGLLEPDLFNPFFLIVLFYETVS